MVALKSVNIHGHKAYEYGLLTQGFKGIIYIYIGKYVLRVQMCE